MEDKKNKIVKLKIKKHHREKLHYYLKNFYKCFPSEKHTIFHFVKYFKARQKNNKDAWLGVSGDTGSGKSLFVLMTMILHGSRMNLTDNVSYIPRGDEITSKFDKLNRQCLLIDEAAREMRSVNWQSKQQQGVNVKAMTDRFKQNWVFLNMPNFNEFTKSMRRTNLIFRAIVAYRTDRFARIIIQRKSRNWRSDDPWDDKRANELYEKFERKNKGALDNETILKIERDLPNTIMDFIVPNLELILPEVTKEYERLKIDSRQTKEEIINESKRNIYKEKYEDLLKMVTKVLNDNSLGIGKVNVPKSKMAEAVGVSISTFRKYLDSPLKSRKKAPGR